MNDSSCVFEIIYNTLQQSHNTMSVKTLCKMAGVSRSGYYAWVKAAPARGLKEQQNRNDFDLILAAYKMHGYTKGAKGIYMALSPYGSSCDHESQKDPTSHGQIQSVLPLQGCEPLQADG